MEEVSRLLEPDRAGPRQAAEREGVGVSEPEPIQAAGARPLEGVPAEEIRAAPEEREVARGVGEGSEADRKRDAERARLRDTARPGVGGIEGPVPAVGAREREPATEPAEPAARTSERDQRGDTEDIRSDVATNGFHVTQDDWPGTENKTV